MKNTEKIKKKKYFVLDRYNGFHLVGTGYYKIENGLLFKANGFDEDYKSHDIIINDEYATWSAFSYDFNVPYKSYFDKKNKIKVNTRIRIITDDSVSLVYDKVPIFVFLNRKERLLLSYRFNKLLVQKKEFWMWVTNVIVALLAAIAGFMVVFC